MKKFFGVTIFLMVLTAYLLSRGSGSFSKNGGDPNEIHSEDLPESFGQGLESEARVGASGAERPIGNEPGKVRDFSTWVYGFSVDEFEQAWQFVTESNYPAQDKELWHSRQVKNKGYPR